MGHLGRELEAISLLVLLWGVGGNGIGSGGIYLPHDPEEGRNYSFSLLF